jgi:hypothetical protein
VSIADKWFCHLLFTSDSKKRCNKDVTRMLFASLYFAAIQLQWHRHATPTMQLLMHYIVACGSTLDADASECVIDYLKILETQFLNLVDQCFGNWVHANMLMRPLLLVDDAFMHLEKHVIAFNDAQQAIHRMPMVETFMYQHMVKRFMEPITSFLDHLDRKSRNINHPGTTHHQSHCNAYELAHIHQARKEHHHELIYCCPKQDQLHVLIACVDEIVATWPVLANDAEHNIVHVIPWEFVMDVVHRMRNLLEKYKFVLSLSRSMGMDSKSKSMSTLLDLLAGPVVEMWSRQPEKADDDNEVRSLLVSVNELLLSETPCSLLTYTASNTYNMGGRLGTLWSYDTIQNMVDNDIPRPFDQYENYSRNQFTFQRTKPILVQLLESDAWRKFIVGHKTRRFYPFSIIYEGEIGIGAGPMKEWVVGLLSELFAPELKLWQKNDTTGYWDLHPQCRHLLLKSPSEGSYDQRKLLCLSASAFNLCLLLRIKFPFRLSLSLSLCICWSMKNALKHLLSRNLEEMLLVLKAEDADLAESFQQLLKSDSATLKSFQLETKSETEVTTENVRQFVQTAICDKFLEEQAVYKSFSIRERQSAYMFHFSLQDLSTFLHGESDSSAAAAAAAETLDLSSYFINSLDCPMSQEQYEWFIHAMSKMSPQEQRAMVRFCTGAHPLGILESVTLVYMPNVKIDNFPVARTCFRQLEVPKFSDKEIMLQRLTYIINGQLHSTSGWEFSLV